MFVLMALTALRPIDFAFFTVFAGLLAVVAVAFVVLRFVLAQHIWHHAKNSPIRRWIGENAVRTDTPTATTTEAWSQYDRYAWCRQMIVLRGGSMGGYAVFSRTHCASDDDWQRFMTLVENNVPFGRWGLITR
jgi:hypothetical protein